MAIGQVRAVPGDGWKLGGQRVPQADGPIVLGFRLTSVSRGLEHVTQHVAAGGQVTPVGGVVGVRGGQRPLQGQGPALLGLRLRLFPELEEHRGQSVMATRLLMAVRRDVGTIGGQPLKDDEGLPIVGAGLLPIAQVPAHGSRALVGPATPGVERGVGGPGLDEVLVEGDGRSQELLPQIEEVRLLQAVVVLDAVEILLHRLLGLGEVALGQLAGGEHLPGVLIGAALLTQGPDRQRRGRRQAAHRAPA